ncbi:hypothetical protein D3C84_1086480 [compost metagenome]
MESVVPLPLLPAASARPLLSSTIRLVVSVMLAVGVRVAVQVMPPSPLLRLLRAPLATVKSPMARPLTASLKVIVTVLVSPTARAVSATTMLAVGRRVSMA